MKVIGICGSTGSGKSTLCDLLRKMGYPVLDCDKIYHTLVNSPSDCLDEICNSFGKNLVSDGALDRRALGKIVFSSPEKLDLLNKISHHFVTVEIQKEIDLLKEKNFSHCFIDAPMLYEAGLESICHLVCVVISDEEKQIARVCARDGITPDEAKKRIKNQTSNEYLRQKADYIIENTGSLEEFYSRCQEFFEKIELSKG